MSAAGASTGADQLTAPTIRVVTRERGFPECPRWRNGELFFTLNNNIMVCGPDGVSRVFGTLEAPLALGLAFFDDGSVLSGSAFNRRLYRVHADGRTTLFADLSDEIPDIMNECVISPDGNIYVGSVGFNLLKGEAPKPTRLVRIAPDGAISRTGPELNMPNGMVLSDDGRTLYVAETMGARITALSIESDGNIEPDHVVADLSGSDAIHPDGFAICPDGTMLYADPLVSGDRGLVHVAPGGKELGRYSVGMIHAIACTMGGDEGRTVFAVAADAMAHADQELSQPAVVIAFELADRMSC